MLVGGGFGGPNTFAQIRNEQLDVSSLNIVLHVNVCDVAITFLTCALFVNVSASQELSVFMRKWSHLSPGLPVLVTGDFNIGTSPSTHIAMCGHEMSIARRVVVHIVLFLDSLHRCHSQL